jgi:hypothetical protein
MCIYEFVKYDPKTREKCLPDSKTTHNAVGESVAGPAHRE